MHIHFCATFVVYLLFTFHAELVIVGCSFIFSFIFFLPFSSFSVSFTNNMGKRSHEDKGEKSHKQKKSKKHKKEKDSDFVVHDDVDDDDDDSMDADYRDTQGKESKGTKKVSGLYSGAWH